MLVMRELSTSVYAEDSEGALQVRFFSRHWPQMTIWSLWPLMNVDGPHRAGKTLLASIKTRLMAFMALWILPLLWWKGSGTINPKEECFSWRLRTELVWATHSHLGARGQWQPQTHLLCQSQGNFKDEKECRKKMTQSQAETTELPEFLTSLFFSP